MTFFSISTGYGIWGAQNDRTGLASIFTIEVDLTLPSSIEIQALLWVKMTKNQSTINKVSLFLISSTFDFDHYLFHSHPYLFSNSILNFLTKNPYFGKYQIESKKIKISEPNNWFHINCQNIKRILLTPNDLQTGIYGL